MEYGGNMESGGTWSTGGTWSQGEHGVWGEHGGSGNMELGEHESRYRDYKIQKRIRIVRYPIKYNSGDPYMVR